MLDVGCLGSVSGFRHRVLLHRGISLYLYIYIHIYIYTYTYIHMEGNTAKG